ncbi:hypothetical protein GW17_00044738 [Ensete ventricosum]|nr:hypothetical protein GW17_00044738 [Ensete ventricosum]
MLKITRPIELLFRSYISRSSRIELNRISTKAFSILTFAYHLRERIDDDNEDEAEPIHIAGASKIWANDTRTHRPWGLHSVFSFLLGSHGMKSLLPHLQRHASG